MKQRLNSLCEDKESVFALWGHRLLDYLILLFEADSISSQSRYSNPRCCVPVCTCTPIVLHQSHNKCETIQTIDENSRVNFSYTVRTYVKNNPGEWFHRPECAQFQLPRQLLVPQTHKTNSRLWACSTTSSMCALMKIRLKFCCSLGAPKQTICQRALWSHYKTFLCQFCFHMKWG